MPVRKLSKMLMVMGTVGYLYSFGNAVLIQEPEKPDELNRPGIERIIEYQEIKRVYDQERDYFAERIAYSALFGCLSLIPLYIGLKRDKKAIIDYLKQKSKEQKIKKYGKRKGEEYHRRKYPPKTI